jgi:hypothetical protein
MKTITPFVLLLAGASALPADIIGSHRATMVKYPDADHGSREAPTCRSDELVLGRNKSSGRTQKTAARI